jgi:Flp pilus assembly protein TadG
MQRLTRRATDERGATAVLFALLLVPLLGFTAIAVDIGAVYAERAKMQTAADAAALAVAQNCARGACGDMQTTAQTMVAANDAGVATAPVVLTSNPPGVTVTGTKSTEHWFAPALGIRATQVHASATVSWGSPQAGTAVLPLAFSWCSFRAQTGGGLPSGTTPTVIMFPKTATDGGCTGPSGNPIPGGFAYLDPDPGHCQATSQIGQTMGSSTGNSVPSPCSSTDFSAWIGQTVLLPLYDRTGAQGSGAWYHVYAYAAFKLTGYYLAGQYRTSPQPCTGNDRCVAGYFTRFVDLSDRFTYSTGGPDTGADILRLIR